MYIYIYRYTHFVTVNTCTYLCVYIYIYMCVCACVCVCVCSLMYIQVLGTTSSSSICEGCRELKTFRTCGRCAPTWYHFCKAGSEGFELV